MRLKWSQIMQGLRSWLAERRFLHDVLTVAGGAIAAQAILILASPILTRLYTPQEFGMLAVFSSCMTILLSMASLRYEMAITLPREDEEAANLLVLCLLLVLGMTLLSGVVVWAVGKQLCEWFGARALAAYLWCLPLGLLGAGMSQVLMAWASRKRLFSTLSWTKGMQSLGQVVVQLGGGIWKIGVSGLLGGYIISQFLGLGTLIRKAKVPLALVTRQGCARVAMIHRGFPMFTLWGSLIVVAGYQLPPILFARYFSLDVSGFFSLAVRVLGLPAVLIGTAVGQVFYPTITSQKNDGIHPRRLFEQTAKTLLIVAFMIFGFIGIHGPELFTLFFGEKWRTTGLYAQYLAPWLMMSFVSSPLSTYSFVAGALKQSVAFSAVTTALRIASIWYGGKIGSPEVALALFTGSGVVMYIIYFAWMLRLVESSLFMWVNSMKGPILVLTVAVAGLFALKGHLPSMAAAAVSLLVLSFLGFMFLRKIDHREAHE